MSEQNKKHVVDVRTKQKACCWCRNKQKKCCWCKNKTKKMLLMLVFIRTKSDHLLALSVPEAWVSHSSFWDLTDVTLTCEDSHNLSKSRATSLCLLQNQSKLEFAHKLSLTLNKVEVGLKNSIKFKGSMPWVIIKTLQFCCHIISLQSMRFSDSLIRKTH